MRRFPLLIPVLAVALVGAGEARTFGQNSVAPSTNADIVKIVTTGEIRKVDTKKKSFEIKITFDNAPMNRPQNRSSSGGGPPIGMGGRRGGMGGGRRGGMGYPSPAQNRTQTTTLNVKVFASDRTLLRDGEANIDFKNLKNGQLVTITGIHRETGKNDVEAQEISRAN